MATLTAKTADDMIAAAKSGASFDEKYKLVIDKFGLDITKALAQALADVSSAIHMKSGSDPDIGRILEIMTAGPSISLVFPTPSLEANISQKTKIESAATSSSGATRILGGNVSVSGGWTF